MFTLIGEDDVGRCYTAVLYHCGCLAALPWGDVAFDCVVFLCRPLGRSEREELCAGLARANVDWIQVAGRGAEELHDDIDLASVSLGRQTAVGDGSPMTSWHEEARTSEEMAEVAALCFGGNDRVLVLVVGQEQDLSRAVEMTKRRTNR